MSLATIMIDLLDFRANAVNQEKETVSSLIAAWRKVARSQTLKRDQHAISVTLDGLIHKLNTEDLTLAYQYKGELYAVHSSYKQAPRNGVHATEYLHTLGLSMAEWDTMPKFHIWVDTGKIYAPCL